MRTRFLIVLTVIWIILLGACSPTGSPTSAATTAAPQNTSDPIVVPSPMPTAAPPPEHVIAIRTVSGEAEFYDRSTGERFLPRGTNYIHIVRTESNALQDRLLGTADFEPDVIRAHFQQLNGLGYNTVRIFIDSCNRGPTCITNGDQPGLNPDYLDNLVTLMQIAKEEGIFLLLTSNDLPSGGSYTAIADRDPNADPLVTTYRNGQLLTTSGQEATAKCWEDLRSGLGERRAAFDAVLAWELFNEQWLFTDQPPLSLDRGIFTGIDGTDYDLSDPEQKRALVADHLMAFTGTMRGIILEHDPTALVTMGFFVPDFPNPIRIGDNRYVDTASLIERKAPLDFYDIHPYPGGAVTIQELAENFAIMNFKSKPVVVGEYGAFKSKFTNLSRAARAMGEWAAGFCELGTDGYLYWTLTSLPAALGDPTWGLVEQDNYMLELFAPVNQPDVCIAPEVDSGNLAFNAAVTASLSLPNEPPALAVDEKADTQWGAGADAPQWIQIDLGEEVTVTTIRLLVAQYPAGDTVHEIRVRNDATPFEAVHIFNESTSGDRWLTFTPDAPLENVRYVRIYTLSSPSWVAWKAIEVR